MKLDFAFGPEFQENMIRYMLEDLGFANKVLSFIPEDRLYSDAHKYIYKRIEEKIKDGGDPLTYIEVEDHLKTVERHKRRMLKTFAKKIFNKKAENPKFLKEKLTDYAKKNAFIEVFMTAQTFWNSRKHDDAYTYTMEGINNLYSISFKDDANIPVGDFEGKRQLYLAEAAMSHKRIPTAIGTLDEILRGGLEKGELGIILAEPKKGKSIGLVHMACTALTTMSGHVAYFLLEGTTDQAILRFLSRLSGIEYRRLELDQLTDNERTIIKKLEKRYIDRLILIPFNQHWNYTVHDVEARLKEFETAGLRPDLIVIDYADLLTVPNKSKMEKRHEQTEVYRDLKRLAVMKKMAIWTASQAARPKDSPENEYLLRAKDISESYEKVRIADLVVTLNQTPKEKESGIVRFHIDIYRSSESDRTITLLTNFEKMIFHSKKYGEAGFKMDLNFEWMQKARKGRRKR